MKFLADENIEREFVEALREADFDVLSVRESYVGFADDEILQIAADEKAVILTYDMDFGELIFRFGLQSHGVIFFANSRFKFRGENANNDSRHPQTRIRNRKCFYGNFGKFRANQKTFLINICDTFSIQFSF
jgi:hypothetical protein